ncbi:MAG: DUF2851 family protein [Paludibacteraceae bacterium]|nr:DUF2851 family protein [Paludibacteraceae bacterium]
MPEIVLHYIWWKGLFLNEPQYTTDGRRVEVVSTGRHNLCAGPDFTDVRVRIDGVELAGEIEIHVDSRDWYHHHHDIDAAYDRVLLHVVSRATQPVYNSKGQVLPQMELCYPHDRDYVDGMLSEALAMDSAVTMHRCAEHLMNDPGLVTEGWKQTMLHRRMECKRESIMRLLQVTHNDWRYAFYVCMAHAFGFHINGVPMELLALATPLAVLAKHRNQMAQLSALLLGQAGLLDEDEAMWNEYMFLQHKYGLKPIDASLWKQGGLRPQNRPRVRIMQLAELIHHGDGLLSQCMDTTDVGQLQDLLAVAQMGKASVDSVLINVVAPFMYARGQRQEAFDLLRQLPAEDNRIVRQWKTIGQSVHTASDTQALLHLYETYCESGRCMHCGVWSEISNR